MNKFNTVKEIISWRPFEYGEQVYDLSHLDAHLAEYTDKQGIKYKYIVTYSFHCFAKDDPSLSEEESNLLLYKTRKENRHFNFERYELSKYLPTIILSLGSGSAACFHGGYDRFVRYEVKDDMGNTINYFIVFKSFRENKRLRLHIESAYPVNPEEKGGLKKINFFAIAHKTLHGKVAKKPVA
ncbi:MAG: heat-shock protein [Halobacteriota archaeon]